MLNKDNKALVVPSDAGVAMVTKVVYINYFQSSKQQDS
jgi:hypothetical protein